MSAKLTYSECLDVVTGKVPGGDEPGRFSESQINAIYRDAAEMYAEQWKPKWEPCTHKTKLPAGEYFIRIGSGTFATARRFTVSRWEAEREIPFHDAKAYYKVQFPTD